MDAKEISANAGLPEKEVYAHLEHIRRSLLRQRERLVMQPPVCRKCGFVFAKRERLGKPGRCPRCRGESISPPLFSIRTV
jgi:predicted Zn-ribbon and HTH transcriptional regulator